MVSSIDGGVGVRSPMMTRQFSEIAAQSPALASYDGSAGKLGDAARTMAFGARSDATMTAASTAAAAPRILYAELGKPAQSAYAGNLDKVTAGGGVANLLQQRADFRPFPERPPALQQANFNSDTLVAHPPLAGEKAGLRTAVDRFVPQRTGPTAVSEFAATPAYRQFSDGLTPLAVDHSFTLDSTNVHQTALAGPYKYWTRDQAKMSDGTTLDVIKDPAGKERFRMQMAKNGNDWKITETDYQMRDGRESLWRSATREYSSAGTRTVNNYKDGVKVSGKTDQLDLKGINV
jgi:hypothetical protein